jgi:ubiquinone/menaquinone biosynthesis C-methylase UbiE
MKGKNIFSCGADRYIKYRPTYPKALFRYLSTLTDEHDTALDCACGNGQAALGLAPYFKQVIATDPSKNQLRNAIPHTKVRYVAAPAERTGLPDSSVDLLTVAEGFHWFDFKPFHKEARRVLKPGGVIALWGYWLAPACPSIDRCVDRYFYEILRPFWRPELKWLMEKFQTIPFPYKEIKTPPFQIVMRWDMATFKGYLSTWSAAVLFMQNKKVNPVTLIQDELRQAWGDPSKRKAIRWPLFFRIGQLPAREKADQGKHQGYDSAD